MRDDRELRMNWLALACASLAGGQSSKNAIASADMCAEAMTSRFPEPKDEDD